VFREGKDVTVIAHGYMVYWALQIATELKNRVSIEVINLHTIKPLDEAAILKSAKKTRRIFCAEDHNVIGGLGSAVAEFLSQNYPVPIKLHGVDDVFAESGSVKDLWKKYKLDKEGVKEALIKFIDNK